MRGFLNYDQAMHKIDRDDLKIFQDIIAENMELTKETKMPFL